jgi:short subunit dehydrogenase-like uncharacterized protein
LLCVGCFLMPKLDLVVYGASGFTGRLVARYLAQHAPPTLRWGLAGRTLDKLEAIKSECVSLNPSLAALVPLILGDGATIGAVAASAVAVISTAGPFSLYGEPLLAACAEQGTHYADITGETAWVEAMEAKYGARARATGAIIVPMCGLDSLPSDLGALFAVERARQRCSGAGVSSVTTYIQMRGGVSGGTIATGRAIAAHPVLSVRSRDPFLLVPASEGHAPSQLVAPLPDSTWPAWVPTLQAYATHVVMAALNVKVVRRSAGLFACRGAALAAATGEAAAALPRRLAAPSELTASPYAYSRAAPFGYSEYSVVRSYLSALLAKVAGVVIGALLFQPWVFACVSGWLPKQGQGPSDASIAKGWFHYYVLARTEEAVPRTVAIKVSGGDPG